MWWSLSTILLTVGLAVGVRTVINDYHRFKSLGPGGIPYNVMGYLIVTLILRPLSLSKKATTTTAGFPTITSEPSASVLSVPIRKGVRPEVGDIVPHRQLSQQRSEVQKDALDGLFDAFIQNNLDLVEKKVSHYETHNAALYVKSNVIRDDAERLPDTCVIAQGEIGHVHADSSVHLYFSPTDAAVIMDKGWGERHRLAKRIWGKPVIGIDCTYILLYIPRDQEELAVLRTLLHASAAYMLGLEATSIKTA